MHCHVWTQFIVCECTAVQPQKADGAEVQLLTVSVMEKACFTIALVWLLTCSAGFDPKSYQYVCSSMNSLSGSQCSLQKLTCMYS